MNPPICKKETNIKTSDHKFVKKGNTVFLGITALVTPNNVWSGFMYIESYLSCQLL